MSEEINKSTYAVVGDPVEHSLSPVIHRLFAKQMEQSISYNKWHLRAEEFNLEVKNFFAQGGGGLNITVPHKQSAFELCDELSSRAKIAQAVNTLYQKNNKVIGDNTDGVGLLNDLARLGWILSGKKILILGAGGAVRGVLQPLLEAKPASIVIANRTFDKAQQLVASFKSLANQHKAQLNASAITAELSPADIIINGTSASLLGGNLALAKEVVEGANCYDMVYAKNLTPFMSWALDSGALNVADGLGMLVGQAAESFFIWRGVRPDVQPVIDHLRQQLVAGR